MNLPNATPNDLPDQATFGPFHEPGSIVQGSLDNHFVEYGTKIPLAEPSSTVPNATMTQQRVLETVVAPNLLGLNSDRDLPVYRPPEGSFPWSEFMQLSPNCSGERAVSPAQTYQTAQDMPATQQSRRCSSVRLIGSPSIDEPQLEPVDPLGLVRPPVEPLSSQEGQPTNISFTETHVAKSNIKKPSSERKNKIVVPSDSDDDLADTGLPQEQYKPRPSRSRSLKVDTEESIEFSIRPEKATRGSKRRRTTASSSTELITTPQKIAQICDMGFSPTKTKKALRRNNGNISHTIEWLVNNGMSEDELAPQNTPKKRTTTQALEVPASDLQSQAQLSVDACEHNPVKVDDALGVLDGQQNKSSPGDTIAVAAAQTKSPQVQVLIPPKSAESKSPQKFDLRIGSQNPKKAKRRKTTLDIPETDSADFSSVPVVVAEKKRGRGRPKKAAAPVLPNEVEEALPERTTVPDVGRVESSKNDMTKSDNLSAAHTKPEIVTEVTQQAQNVTAEEVDDLSKAKSPIQKGPSISDTPDRPKNTLSNLSSTKGKVPYRVGLSKRTRIAPLLRTLKK